MTSIFERFSALVTAMVLASVATAFAVFPVMFVPSLQLPAARYLCDGEAEIVELPAAQPASAQAARKELRCTAEPERDIAKSAMVLTFFGVWAVLTLLLVVLFAIREQKATLQEDPPDEDPPSG